MAIVATFILTSSGSIASFVLDKLIVPQGSLPSALMPRLTRSDALTKAIGRRVRELRRERGMTVEKLGYENGISKGTISDLERALVRPSVVTLKKIADGLGVDLLDLFTWPRENERHRVVDLTRRASIAKLRAAASALERG